MKVAIAATLFAGAMLSAPHAQACSGLIGRETVTGETYSSDSPEWFRREQAGWRAQSDAVFLAQVSATRMLDQSQVAITLHPIHGLYDTAPPAGPLILTRHRGNTCNRPLDLGDVVVIYAARSGPDWSIVGFAAMRELQDRPAGMPTERDFARGFFELPDYPD